MRNTPSSIVIAKSAEEAYKLVRAKRPSLVYMDIDMPDIDGLTACRQLKKTVELRGIPVILIGDNPALEAEARAAGCDDFLTKPLDRRLFLEKGHQFLVSIDRREQRRNCKLPVRFSCRGKSVQGHCLDLSSGGMFLDCVPEARKGDRLWLNFILPDAESTGIEVYGRVAWVNNDEQIIKDDYPYGYGVEFVDIPEETGVALRRHFGI